MKSKLIFFVRLTVLVVLYFICFAAVSSALFQLPAEQAIPADGNPAIALLVVSCLNTVILSYVIIRSRWAGWKLIGAVFLIFFGISTIMPQIETAYFLTRLPPGMLPRIFLAGGITVALFSPLAVLMLGKRRHNGPDKEDSSRLNMSVGEWAWKQSLIVVAYLVIYFTFGYFIAWKSPAVRAYYGGSDPGSFLAQMNIVLRNTPWLLPLQVVRAMLWTALAVLVIRLMKGRWWEIGLVVGLLFAIPSAQLLIPNPFMPSEVRMVHLLETASSNFLFGWVLVWVLCRLNIRQRTSVMRPVNGIGLRFLLASAVAAAALAASTGAHRAQERPVYLDPGKPLEQRVDDLLSRLTLDEKLSLVHADSKFTTAAIPRLGIPRRWLSDGPHGVREDVGPDTWKPAGRTDDFASSMPALIGLSSSFNPALSRAYGDVIGEEALKRDKQIMLGPGVNIMRTPLNGRNFEYWGEDPFLTSRMAVSYIRGVQSHQVASCVKHLAANNQEWERGTINVEMDERALREIYLPAFKAAVQEGEVWAVMGAYNKFRGEHACHNNYLLNKVLKDEWGFKGLVISDWDGTHDTREAVMNGLDLEMGTEKPYENFYLAGPFREGLRKGEFQMSVLDDKVRRNLRQVIAIGALNKRGPGAINTKAHQETARRVAEEGMVLLKNEGNALPLDDGKLKSVAVIGENAVQLQAYGGGSSRIKTFYEITPLEGIVRRAGERVNVTYSTGYRAERDPDLVGRAVRAASQADVAIIVGGLNHSRYFDSEGFDRKDMKLPYGQDELIQRVVEANPRTIVVFLGGGPLEMGPWLAKVPAVMLAWYSGMEGGNALARVLFGDVNPSGKLPCTFPKRLEDSPAHALGAYPGKNGQEVYAEGLLVGYRWFDTKKIEPLFPFGYGLSYTSFKYSSLKLTEGRDAKGPVVIAEFEIENTGTREGGEVAQLYVHQTQPRLPRPVKELKGFHKVFLKPGEKQKISLPLDRSAFAYYDPDKKGWLAERGEFTILIGSSSRDIHLESKFQLNETSLEK